MKVTSKNGSLERTRKFPVVALSSQSVPPSSKRNALGFTLIELMAVVLVIATLAAISMAAMGYVERKVATSTARSQLAAIEAALELYRSDWGFYPATMAARLSADGGREATNNWLLYRALNGDCLNCAKKYMTFSPRQAQTNLRIVKFNIYDPWGAPFVYYNSPTSVFAVYGTPTNVGWTVGGQVNLRSYDLFSLGPDKSTYISGVTPYNGWQGFGHLDGLVNMWMKTSSAVDDVANFNQ